VILSILETAPSSAQTEFFTAESLFTAAGSTTAVITVTSVLQGLFPALPGRWIGLGLSFALTLIGNGVHGRPWNAVNLFLAFINGLVIYAAATGVNTVVTKPPAAPAAAALRSGRSFRWWP